ncbi:hypothetical protein EVAR_57890_1 [Eumeta japonica]|uniref:Uncharacterized protein n=1 Tax=Eumeta variegata TaxID=151549 RepID=A0A4C1YWA8_EUMVA|nr:hypothetical protein EVAR_57890_1 [Eumeta japonica]
MSEIRSYLTELSIHLRRKYFSYQIKKENISRKVGPGRGPRRPRSERVEGSLDATRLNLLVRGRKHSNAVCAIGRHLREPDDARRRPTISDRCLQTRIAHPTGVRSDIFGFEATKRIKGLRCTIVDSVRSNGDVPLMSLVLRNIKNITETQRSTSEVGLHHTSSSAAGYPGVSSHSSFNGVPPKSFMQMMPTMSERLTTIPQDKIKITIIFLPAFGPDGNTLYVIGVTISQLQWKIITFLKGVCKLMYVGVFS